MKTAGVPTDQSSFEDRDAALHQVMTHGPLFGIPVVWLAAFAVATISGAPLVTAAWLSIVPALVGGPFFGGLAVIFHMQLMSEAPRTAPKRSPRRHSRRTRIKAA